MIKTPLKERFQNISKAIDTKLAPKVCGTVVKISGFLIEATGLKASVGTICEIDIAPAPCTCEVIGFAKGHIFLLAFEETFGIVPGHKIYIIEEMLQVPVGWSLLNRIIDGRCIPIDSKGILNTTEHRSLYSKPINPIQRTRISKPLDVGIKALNGLLTIGQGQRIGIFAGSGVGKSVLLGMMTSYTSAEIVVVGLIGERGREVKEFIEENIGAENLKKSIIIASPIDTSPLERANGALVATTIAEYFREQGKNVLLIIDSLTRYAQALRQIYLIQGELPSSKGYSPTVFAKISQLVERAGQGKESQGSITAFYTVLSEGDDMNDPVADHARSILDGHIVLSRKLADSGHYPAIDIGASVSRVMTMVTTDEHQLTVRQFKQLFSAYLNNQDLIKMGMYQSGSDQLVDIAIKKFPEMNQYLQQGINEASPFEDSLHQLMGMFKANE